MTRDSHVRRQRLGNGFQKPVRTRRGERAGVRVHFADPDAEGAVRELLQAADLPVDDLSSHLSNFLLAFAAEQVVGTVGMEFYGRYALLRSLAVTVPFRDRGIGGLLCKHVMDHARARGVEAVYLLTTTAETYFRRRGFRRVDRVNIPEPIRGTREYRELCPATASCMMRRL